METGGQARSNTSLILGPSEVGWGSDVGSTVPLLGSAEGHLLAGAPLDTSKKGALYFYAPPARGITVSSPALSYIGCKNGGEVGSNLSVGAGLSDGPFYGGVSILVGGTGNFDDSEAYGVHRGSAGWGEQSCMGGGSSVSFIGDTPSFGEVVAAGGDLGGDAHPDVVVSAPLEGTPTVTLFFGPSTTSPALSAGHTLTDAAKSYLGAALAIIPDMDGDGLDELLIGAPRYPDNNNQGAAYLFFGRADWSGASSPAQADVVFVGESVDGSPNSQLGSAVASAGDVDGDTVGDLLLGAPRHSNGDGLVYLIFGDSAWKNGSLTTVYLDASLSTGADILRLTPEREKDQLGFDLAPAGDVDGDGRDDFIVGAPFDGPQSGKAPGRAYVIYGGDYHQGGFKSTEISAFVSGDAGLRLEGVADDDHTGFSVAGAGDLDGDGYDEVIVGTDKGTLGAGRAYVVFGGDCAD